MTNKNIFRELGGLDPDLIAKAAPDVPQKKNANKTWVKWASLAACFCLILIAAFAIIPMFNDGDEIIDNVLPTDIDRIIWSNRISSVNAPDEGYADWNGFCVDTPLYDALQNYSDEYIAVIMTKADGQKIEEAEYNAILDKMINRDYKNNNLYLFITKEQFKNWKLENKADYIFCLACRSSYEGTVTEVPTDKIDDSVTDFAYEKFKFSNNVDNIIKSDAEAVAFVYNTYCDHICFIQKSTSREVLFCVQSIKPAARERLREFSIDSSSSFSTP